ncbi:MAG: TetR family transcriptional regulator [Rhodanobacteraceae bacterium]
MVKKTAAHRAKSTTRTKSRSKTVATEAERTRHEILQIATEEFAANGLSGARVDIIAARMRASKRMIYYYFGGKLGLYSAVLEKAYERIRTEEAQSDLAHMPPRDALQRLIEITFEYDEKHTRFVRLVSIENIHRAKYLSKLPSISQINESVIKSLEGILDRGRKSGEFRRNIVALDVHLLISAFCFFRISNRYTLEAVFKCDMFEPEVRDRHRRMIVEAVLSYVTVSPRGSRKGS